MPGKSETTQQTQQNQQTSPWAPAQPLLTGILGQLDPSKAAPTGTETAAFGQIGQNYANAPNYGAAANSTVGNLLTGGPQLQGDLQKNLSGYNSELSPYLSSNYLDPSQNPQLQSVLATIRGDVSNQVNQQFAGAGRDLSGLNQQALARGIAQGEAVPLLNQYNANVGVQRGAQDASYGAGNTTTGAIAGLNQQSLANQTAGLGLVSQIPGIQNQNALGQIGNEEMLKNLPLSYLQSLAGIGVPIAGLGGQSTGTSNTTSSQTDNPWKTAIAGLIGAGTIASKFAFPTPSDARIKENIATIGALNDGLPVYSYNYIGDPVPRIGLMAQDVELRTPGAVHEVGGIKTVDYEHATRRARGILGGD